MAEPAEVIRASLLDGIPHGFLCGANHCIEPDVASIHPGGTLVTVKQVHSARAVSADAPFAEAERPEADALVTVTPGLVLGIVTADCAPVLLADPVAGVVGAAHAGWRGAFGGVVEATVEAMLALGARREAVVAAIGPAIAQPSYEVDQVFHDRLVNHDAANIDLLEPGRTGYYQFDLPAYVVRRLQYGAGITRISNLALDTYTDPARFHSFRRATHRGEPTDGRQFSLIASPPSAPP